MRAFNWSAIKVIKELGAGMFGTAFLIEYDDRRYVQKVQHILSEERKKDYKYELWCELDLYKYIDKLPEDDRSFFTQLHAYSIFQCEHKQVRPFKVNLYDKKNKFAQRLRKLDKSPWCVSYILEYHGDTTLYKFMQNYIKDKPKNMQEQTLFITSLCLQICKIILILYAGGYSHNDLHDSNIMIKPTKEKFFDFAGKKIPFMGYQLCAIDYGLVLNKKFKQKYEGFGEIFNRDPAGWLFYEIMYDTMGPLLGISKLIGDCNKLKMRLPWESKAVFDSFREMITKHPDFFLLARTKYSRIFPRGAAIFDLIIEKLNKGSKSFDDLMHKYIKGHDEELSFFNIVERIYFEFRAFFPDKYVKYWRWCKDSPILVAPTYVQELLEKNNVRDYVGCLLRQFK